MSFKTALRKKCAALCAAIAVGVGAAGIGAAVPAQAAGRSASTAAGAAAEAAENVAADSAAAAEDAAAEAVKAYEEAFCNAWQKLALGVDVNILIIGDSIGEGAGADNSDGGTGKWYRQLADYLTETYYEDRPSAGTVNVNNISLGGNSSYAGYISALSLDDGIDYDLVILCYGQNDAETDLSLYYEAMIRAVYRHYPACEVIAVLESSQLTYTAKIRAIQKLCSWYGIPTADTIAAFEASGYDVLALTSDGIHPNNLGQSIYAQTMAAVIDAQVSEEAAAAEVISAVLTQAAADAAASEDGSGAAWDAAVAALAEAGLLQTEAALPAAYNKKVSMFDNLRCYPAGDESADGETQFVRLNDTTYTISVSASGVMGIDLLYEDGDGVIDVYVDGVRYESSTMLFDCGFAQRYILVVDPDVTAQEQITVIFDTKEQADGFLGVYFSWG